MSDLVALLTTLLMFEVKQMISQKYIIIKPTAFPLMRLTIYCSKKKDFVAIH